MADSAIVAVVPLLQLSKGWVLGADTLQRYASQLQPAPDRRRLMLDAMAWQEGSSAVAPGLAQTGRIMQHHAACPISFVERNLAPTRPAKLAVRTTGRDGTACNRQ